jgi:hypothetical protein
MHFFITHNFLPLMVLAFDGPWMNCPKSCTQSTLFVVHGTHDAMGSEQTSNRVGAAREIRTVSTHYGWDKIFAIAAITTAWAGYQQWLHVSFHALHTCTEESDEVSLFYSI